MKCPNCRCEIGNLTTCPYCGVTLYRRPRSTSTAPVRVPPTRQVQSRQVPPSYNGQRSQSTPRRSDDLSNLELYGLLSVVLLCGIFVLEVLQLVINLL